MPQVAVVVCIDLRIGGFARFFPTNLVEGVATCVQAFAMECLRTRFWARLSLTFRSKRTHASAVYPRPSTSLAHVWMRHPKTQTYFPSIRNIHCSAFDPTVLHSLDLAVGVPLVPRFNTSAALAFRCLLQYLITPILQLISSMRRRNMTRSSRRKQPSELAMRDAQIAFLNAIYVPALALLMTSSGCAGGLC